MRYIRHIQIDFKKLFVVDVWLGGRVGALLEGLDERMYRKAGARYVVSVTPTRKWDSFRKAERAK